MSFYSQQESFFPSSKQKSKYTNKDYKRKKHDSDTKLKRSESNHKSITKQIRAEVQKDFGQKYAEKDCWNLKKIITARNAIQIRIETEVGQWNYESIELQTN